MITFFITSWMIIAVLTAGAWSYLDDSYWHEDDWLLVFICMIWWPIIFIIIIVYIILNYLSKYSTFIAGFLDSMKKKRYKVSCKNCEYCRGDVFDRGYWCKKYVKDIDINNDGCSCGKEKNKNE